MSKDKEKITTEEFDRLFDKGSDQIDEHVDWSKARWVKPEQKRVNVDFPLWMVKSLDREAERLGVTRQSLIKIWLADRLEHDRSGRE